MSSFELLRNRENPIAIIDEAGNFNSRGQAYLRQFWDGIKSVSGLVLSGTERYFAKLNLWNNSTTSGIPEFLSRVTTVIEIDLPSLDDIELICRYNEIDDKKIINKIYTECDDLRDVKDMVIAYHDDTLLY